MKFGYFILIVISLLIGCDTKLNQESVRNYNNHSLNDFVKDKFTINNSLNLLVQNGLNTISSSNQLKLYDYYTRSMPLPDGSYVFYAPLKGNEELEKPKNNLNLFCKMKGGKLENVMSFEKDILSEYEIDSFRASRSSIEELNKIMQNFPVRATNKYRVLSSDEIYTLAAHQVTPPRRHSSLDIPFAKKDYVSAVDKKSFGVFRCVLRNNILWHVSIIPIAYERSNKEHFILDAFYIGIKSW